MKTLALQWYTFYANVYLQNAHYAYTRAFVRMYMCAWVCGDKWFFPFPPRSVGRSLFASIDDKKKGILCIWMAVCDEKRTVHAKRIHTCMYMCMCVFMNLCLPPTQRSMRVQKGIEKYITYLIAFCILPSGKTRGRVAGTSKLIRDEYCI